MLLYNTDLLFFTQYRDSETEFSMSGEFKMKILLDFYCENDSNLILKTSKGISKSWMLETTALITINSLC